MRKDFDSWNERKKSVHASPPRLYKEREFWWCYLGVNIGFEQDGTGNDYERPVLILKGLSRYTCIVVPLTSSPIVHTMRFKIGLVGDREASALLSQIKVVDTKRLSNKIGVLDKEIFAQIRKAVRELF
jgi:mRNA interferase MazF